LLDTVWLIISNTVLIEEEFFMAGIGVLVPGHLNDPDYKRPNRKIAKYARKKYLERLSKGDPPIVALGIAYNAACSGRKDLVGRALYAAFSK